MTTDLIKQQIAAYDQELKNAEANFHRLTGAKLALEALLKTLSQQQDAAPVGQQTGGAAPVADQVGNNPDVQA